MIKPGCFIGLIRTPITNRVVLFILSNPDGSGNVDFVMKKDPSFQDRLICAYKVIEAVFDSKVTENKTEQAA
jgi:hypothetical protein